MDKRRRQQEWGRIGGLTAWSRNGIETMLGPARQGFMARFERAVDPTLSLSPEERTRRAERARRAYMLTLAQKSARVRSEKKMATGASRSAAVAEEHADDPGTPRTPA